VSAERNLKTAECRKRQVRGSAQAGEVAVQQREASQRPRQSAGTRVKREAERASYRKSRKGIYI